MQKYPLSTVILMMIALIHMHTIPQKPIYLKQAHYNLTDSVCHFLVIEKKPLIYSYNKQDIYITTAD